MANTAQQNAGKANHDACTMPALWVFCSQHDVHVAGFNPWLLVPFWACALATQSLHKFCVLHVLTSCWVLPATI